MWRRQRWALIIAGFVLAFGVGYAYAASVRAAGGWENGMPWERRLMISMHQPLPWVLDKLTLVFPWFGTNITLIPGIAALAFWFWRALHRRHFAVQLVVVQVGSYLLNPALKALSDRPRPTMFARRGWYGFSAYPSGHAIASVSVLFTVAILLYRAKGWRWPMYAAALIALGSTYSRVYLGVHWPTDVIGGILVGIVWLAVTLYAFRETAEVISS